VVAAWLRTGCLDLDTESLVLSTREFTILARMVRRNMLLLQVIFR
jgi:hypothetical protein